MNYKISADGNERFQIVFADHVKNIVGLRMAPDSLETELQSGEWLVLAFAVWDSRDRPPIDVACQIAPTLRNACVAVRPFEKTDEFGTWAPQLADHQVTLAISASESDSSREVSIRSTGDDHPMWLVFREGKMSRALIGIKSFDEVAMFANEWLK